MRKLTGMIAHVGQSLCLSLESLRIAAAHVRSDWWKTGNRLPRASVAHLNWRVETAYGDPSSQAAMADVVDFIAWRRRQRRARNR